MSEATTIPKVYRYLHYTLTLQAPVVISHAIPGDPNSATSLPYIPGASMRGVVAARFLQRMDSEDDIFTRVVLSGQTKFLNAYPKVEGIRLRPTPLSYHVWTRDMEEPGNQTWPIVDLAAHQDLRSQTVSYDEDGVDAFRVLSAPFVSTLPGRSWMHYPRTSARLHNQRDREKGRAWNRVTPKGEERRGEIFSFEYLDAGQQFKGAFLVSASTESECSELIEHLRICFEDSAPIFLGKSRRSGYGGHAVLEFDDESSGWQESIAARRVTEAVEPGERFRLVLTSDYIGRNATTGQLDPEFVAQEIVETLGGRARVVHKFWAFGRTGGFNRKWRLEVPQAPTCVAGSVLVLEALEPISVEQLSTIEHEGLGDRCIDGFGRVVFSPGEADTNLVLKKIVSTDEELIDRSISMGESQFAPGTEVYQVERRLLEMGVKETIAATAYNLSTRARNIPNPSVLGRLRVVLGRSPRSALNTMRVWLSDDKDLALRAPALTQLVRCIVEGQSLSDWLKRVSDLNEPLDSLVNLQVVAQENFLTTRENAARHFEDAEFGMAIRVRLMDAVLESLMRRNRMQKRSEGVAGR